VLNSGQSFTERIDTFDIQCECGHDSTVWSVADSL